MSNYCAEIEDRINCNHVLLHFGIVPPAADKRIPCPIHKGEGENFSLHDGGKIFTCFSRNCGSGLNRGPVTLYCLMRWNQGFRNLDRRTKYEALKELCGLAKIDLANSEAIDWEAQATQKYIDKGLETYLVLKDRGLNDEEIRERIDTVREGVKRGMEQDEESPASSWQPHDLARYLSDDYEPEEPAILKRSDGCCLFYRGKTHSVHGESESGKSWVAMIAAAEVIRSGGRVAYLDYESDGASVIGRFRLLGLHPEQIKRGLIYIAPDAGPSESDPAYQSLLSMRLDLAVIDGVNAALATCGGETKETDSVTKWYSMLPRPLTRSTGAAVVLIDHVVKNRDSRGRFAIGSQAKMAMLDGAAYCCEPIESLAPGKVGMIELRVGKDRPGSVRKHAEPDYSPVDRTQSVARIEFDSTGDTINIIVHAPKAISEPGRSLDGPHALMDRILDALIEHNGPMSVRAIRAAVGGRNELITEALRYLSQQQMIDRNAHEERKKAEYFITAKGIESRGKK